MRWLLPKEGNCLGISFESGLLVDLGFDTLGTYGIKAKVAILEKECSEVQSCGAGCRALLWMEWASYTPLAVPPIIAPHLDKGPIPSISLFCAKLPRLPYLQKSRS